MTKQLQWIIGGLALLIVGFVALQIYLFVDMKRFKEKHASPEPKAETKTEQPPEQVQVPEVDNRPAPPDDGREYVWHGDHWHEMPIEQKEPMLLPEGSLTYHEELLKTNPVKALRLQSEERGHWSKDHIPPFPPDDTEAQEFARNRYLMHYYESIGLVDTPIYSKAARPYISQLDVIDEYPSGARKCDLLRITWTNLDAGHITPYGGMTRYGRARMFRSDYFPDFIDVPK